MPAAATIVHDRDERLARHVPAEDHHVGVVVLARVEELFPADLGAVDVGGKEDPHWETSSGSSYQRLRSPTLARSFQPRLFSSSSMRPRSSSKRVWTRSRSAWSSS